MISKPIKSILINEKKVEIFHNALGNAYCTTATGNHFMMHMDVASMQTTGCCGGEIYFDDFL